MTHEELIQTKEYWTAKIQIELFNQLDAYMREHHLTRSEFAKKLGVTKGYVSQILNGNSDHRISKVIELLLAIDLVPNFNFETKEEYLKKESLKIQELKEMNLVG